jgi:hypothetical protein
MNKCITLTYAAPLFLSIIRVAVFGVLGALANPADPLIRPRAPNNTVAAGPLISHPTGVRIAVASFRNAGPLWRREVKKI